MRRPPSRCTTRIGGATCARCGGRSSSRSPAWRSSCPSCRSSFAIWGSQTSRAQRWSGAILAAPFLFAALMTPVWGYIGDRVGRKAMVVRALLGLSVALVLMGFARTPAELLALRIVQGMVSGFIPAAIALVSQAAPRADLGYALGTLSSAQAAGVVIGPLLGGVLADALGFRNLFFVTAAIEAVCGIAVILLVRETRHARGAD